MSISVHALLHTINGTLFKVIQIGAAMLWLVLASDRWWRATDKPACEHAGFRWRGMVRWPS
jgi:hypothetical protein